MIICPGCKKEFNEPDEPCHKCKGARLVTIKQKKGPLTKQIEVEKEVICPRCNGKGLEIVNNNRNNRKRGASNEYRITDVLIEWWRTPEGNRCEFRKTPQSGGSKLADSWDLAGDVASTDKTFPLHIEAKHTDQWDFAHLLVRPHEIYGDLKKYIIQAIEDTPPTKIPSLWLQHFGPSQPTFVMIFYKADRNNVMGWQNNIWTGYAELEINGLRGIWRYHIMSVDTLVNIEPAAWRFAAKEML